MNTEEIVNIDNLKKIAFNIDKKKDEIKTLYEMKIKSIVDFSKECIIKNGADYDKINNNFNELFNDLDNRLNILVDLLNNKIIPSYSDLSVNIKEYFNNQFALELENLLDTNNE